MNIPKKKAAALTATPKHNQQQIVYHLPPGPSSGTTKGQLGELLLALCTPLDLKRQQQLLRAFDVKLRRYLDLRDLGVRYE